MRSKRSCDGSVRFIGHVYRLYAGCTRRCSSQCEPRGPWQSPTIQARGSLLVNTTELRIFRIDGRNVRPSCIGQGGVHEYLIAPGEHELTASFRYMARVGAGLISEAYGRPLTLCHTFLPGHEYVAVYREQFLPKAEAATLAQALAITVLQPHEGTWSMRIIDLADAEPDDGRCPQGTNLQCPDRHRPVRWNETCRRVTDRSRQGDVYTHPESRRRVAPTRRYRSRDLQQPVHRNPASGLTCTPPGSARISFRSSMSPPVP